MGSGGWWTGARGWVRERMGGRFRTQSVTTQSRTPPPARFGATIALAKVWRRWSRVSATGDPHAYVRRVLINTATSAAQRRWSREYPTAAPPEPLPAGPGPADTDLRLALDRLLPMLLPRQRLVLVLRYYEDLPVAEVAEVLGCSAGTVKSQAARALARLSTSAAVRRRGRGGAGGDALRRRLGRPPPHPGTPGPDLRLGLALRDTVRDRPAFARPRPAPRCQPGDGRRLHQRRPGPGLPGRAATPGRRQRPDRRPTLYDRSPRPCRLAGTVRLTALDAAGRPIPLQGTAATGPVDLTLPASSPDDPVGLEVSLRATTTDPSTGATCPTADRVTPAQLRLTTGPTVQVLVTTANEPAHSAPLWGCRGAIALLAAS